MIQEAEAYREQVVSRATGEAERFTKVLVEYSKAPKVTRERLYLEAMESVLSNTSKVMVDVKKGNSLIYSPLDRITSRQGLPADLQNAQPGGDNSSTTPADPRDSRRERFRTREVR